MIFKKWPFITVLAATITIFAAGVSTEPSKPTIIIIQGCSSSGKSSTAQELQNLYANDNKPFVYLPMDNFLSFLPKKWLNFNPHDSQFNETADDGIRFISVQDENSVQSLIKLTIGQTALNAFNGIVKCISGLAKCNNNVIFEGAFPSVLFKNIEQLKCKYAVIIINVTCDLKIMEKREIQRNGMIGLARSLSENPEFQYDNYDFVVDTSDITPAEAAQQIKAFIEVQ